MRQDHAGADRGRRRGYAYFSFDDDVAARRRARRSGRLRRRPAGARDSRRVQRVPALFTALKLAVDRRRSAGRFLLTGSANVLLVPKLADSLAGRMEILRLHPLAQCELARREPRFLEALFNAGFKTRRSERLADELRRAHRRRRLSGGARAADSAGGERPGTATTSTRWSSATSATWRASARSTRCRGCSRSRPARTARLLNVSDLAAPFQVSRPTIRDYVTLLERVFLLDELPPWHSNRLSRLVKTPKLHVGDTGLACALLGVDAAALKADRTVLGQLLETFVFQELRRQASWHDEPLAFYHFRDRDGVEVDVVIERGAREWPASRSRPQRPLPAADFRGLRKLKEAAGRRFVAGVVLYDGETSASFGDGLFAVPMRALWEPA